jgi:nickel/cobalt exporter
VSFEALSLSALTLGAIHGLGADHLMAIAALAVGGESRQRQARALRTAVGFAGGHAVLLGLAAIVAALFGVVVPASVSAGGERIGGAVLIALGGLGFWSITSGRAYGHIHADGTPPSRWHVHLSGLARHPAGGHAASPVPAAMGALFAVSSLRALMLLQPFGADARAMALPALLLLIVLFGLGILLSMSIFGVLLARVLSIRAVERFGQAATGAVAIASMALGLYWLVA